MPPPFGGRRELHTIMAASISTTGIHPIAGTDTLQPAGSDKRMAYTYTATFAPQLGSQLTATKVMGNEK